MQSIKTREQTDEHMDDMTGFQEGGNYRNNPEGELEQQKQEEETGGESAELTVPSDQYEDGPVNQSRPDDGSGVGAGSEGAVIEPHEMTPYVASCSAHVETLRKRKREQEERVETLVQGADEMMARMDVCGGLNILSLCGRIVRIRGGDNELPCRQSPAEPCRVACRV